MIKCKHILNEFFDEIIVISSESKFLEWYHINQYFIKKNIFVTRIEEITESQIKKFQNQQYNKMDISKINKRTLTYFKIFNYINTTMVKKFLILESNIIFIKNFEKEFTKNINSLNNWDFWYLGYNITSQNNSLPEPLVLSKETNGLFAFAINNLSYNYIYQNVNIYQDIESFLLKIQGRPPLITLSSRKPLIKKQMDDNTK